MGTADCLLAAIAGVVAVHLDGDFAAGGDGAGGGGFAGGLVAAHGGRGDGGDGVVVGGEVGAGASHVLGADPELLPGGVGSRCAGEGEERE